ncbi:DNA-binding protein [Thiocapsa bogorovii]|uniref:DNA-binding protein n=1 Tax=Thiocapsa bogorovii TaxID=521689 RepID=UPI0038CD8480
MPQPRLDPEQIRGATQALLDAGRSPTVIAVRHRLGGGSPRTIASVLAHWLAEQQGRAGFPRTAQAKAPSFWGRSLVRMNGSRCCLRRSGRVSRTWRRNGTGQPSPNIS